MNWIPTEISLAPVPADINSGIRAANNEQNEVEINFNSKQKMEQKKKRLQSSQQPYKKGRRNHH
jgi:hypothetical protein